MYSDSQCMQMASYCITLTTYLNMNVLLFFLECAMAVLVSTKPEPGEGVSPVKRRGVTLAVLTAYPCSQRTP